jgi:hypothetical protein
MQSTYILIIVIICIARLSSVIASTFTIDNHPTNHRHHNYLHTTNKQRNLQQFFTINNILSEITLVLPDADVSSNGLDISITDLLCYDTTIQDVQVSRSTLTQSDRVSIHAIGMTITCNFRWQYEWSVLSLIQGRGSGKAIIDKSSGAVLTLDIGHGSPPRDVRVESCVADVQIGDLVLDGDRLGAVASIINLFKRLVMGLIEDEVNRAVCNQVNELGTCR